MYNIGKLGLPHLSPQCVKKVVYSHHQAMGNLSNKRKAIFKSNILNDMHTNSFLTLSSLTLHCHLHPLQAAICCRKSRLVVDEDDLN